MADVTCSDILQAIYSTLTADPSLVPDTLKQVKLGVDANHDAGFPYCRVYLLQIASSVEDTVSYLRKYTFAIEIWQEYSQASKETAELNLCNAVEAVLNRLNGEWQLGIGVELSEVEAGPVGVKETNSAPVRAATIRFTVSNLVQNPQ